MTGPRAGACDPGSGRRVVFSAREEPGPGTAEPTEPREPERPEHAPRHDTGQDLKRREEEGERRERGGRTPRPA
ncbi:MAG TPA: hypothetical protein VIC56_01215 [Gemmatimonadota bacterium]